MGGKKNKTVDLFYQGHFAGNIVLDIIFYPDEK
jgi:hypothetical protein